MQAGLDASPVANLVAEKDEQFGAAHRVRRSDRDVRDPQRGDGIGRLHVVDVGAQHVGGLAAAADDGQLPPEGGRVVRGDDRVVAGWSGPQRHEADEDPREEPPHRDAEREPGSEPGEGQEQWGRLEARHDPHLSAWRTVPRVVLTHRSGWLAPPATRANGEGVGEGAHQGVDVLHPGKVKAADNTQSMSKTVRLSAALLSAFAVLAFGAVYLVERPARWTSTASMVLVPVQGDEQSSIIQSFGQSGTAGTVVEYLSGPAVRQRAGAPRPPGVSPEAGGPAGDLQVRLVPDTRVINLTLTAGQKGRVRRDLDAIARAGVLGQDELGDPWRIRVLAPAGAPVQAGPAALLVVVATLLVALLAGLAVFVIPTRRRTPAEPSTLGAVGESERRHAA